MAIQLDLTTSQYGTAFSAAYFRIVTTAISRQREGGPKFTVMIDVYCWWWCAYAWRGYLPSGTS